MMNIKVKLTQVVFCLSFIGIIGTLQADDHAAMPAESAEVKIARAVSAAPMMISAEATILDVDGTVLREGDNGWTCYPGVPLIPGDKHPMCNDAVWTAWLAAAFAGETYEAETIGFSYMLQGDAMVSNADPGEMDHTKGHWIQEGPHIMLLLPKSAIGDLTDSPFESSPYVMWGETPMRHIMVPVADRPKGQKKMAH